MTTTETTLDAVYEAWQSEQDAHTTHTRERFDEALIGEFYSHAELAEHVLDNTGDVDDLLNKVDSHLAPYLTFDYQMFGRDLELSGDVYTVELQLPIGTAGHTIKRTYYFWSSI
jgi:antirestriction protein